MRETWNLDRLYAGFEDPAFSRDLAAYENKIAEFVDLAQHLDAQDAAQTLRSAVDLLEQITLLGGKLGAYPRLRNAADTKDNEAASWSGRIMAMNSRTAGAKAAFRAWVVELPNLMELVRQDAFLRDYEFYFEGLLKMSRHNLGVEAAGVAAKLHMSGTSAWSKLHSQLTSTVTASYRGEDITLSAVRNLARDPDPQVRRDAYEAELGCYDAIRVPCAHALNASWADTSPPWP